MRKTAVFLMICLAAFLPANACAENDLAAVQDVVYAWQDAWQNRDIRRFVSFYSPRFGSKTLGLQGLIQQKTRLFQRPGPISVEISDLNIEIQDRRAVADFLQRYRSPAYSDVGIKTLVLTKTESDWKISAEEWRPVKDHGGTPDVTPAPSPAGRPAVTDISVTIQTDGSETVSVSMNHFVAPEIMTLEEIRPRIAIDINNVAAWNGQPLIHTTGNLVKQIRTYLHRDNKKLRIVLDLDPATDYAVTPASQPSDGVFSLNIKPLTEAREKTPERTGPKPTWKIISREGQPAPAPAETTRISAAPSPGKKPGVPGIDFAVEKDGTEKVFVSMDYFAVPKVMTLEGDNPRIFIDLENTPSWNGSPLIRTNGKLIKQIRTHLHRDDKKLRIVLDLDPAKNYSARLTYEKTKNIYCMQVGSLPPVAGSSPVQETPEPAGRIISEPWQAMPEGEAPAETPGMPPQPEALAIKRIDFKIEKEGTEKVYIEMNRHAVPEIMALEGDNPRIAVDIKNIVSWHGKPAVPVNGKLIRQIRTHLHPDDQKLRIVIDLDPEADYSVNPTYYRLNNIYCVEVKPSPGTPR